MIEQFDVMVAMDTGFPEVTLTPPEPIGQAVEFYVEAGERKSVTFDISSVKQLGPPGANAFLLESAYLANADCRTYLVRFKYFRISRNSKVH